MSRLNRIILTPDRATPVEGYLASGETLYPGMIVQEDPTQTEIGGRRAWKLYSRDADGNNPKGPFIIVTEDILQGKTMSDAYGTGSGTRLFGAIPKSGCEFNGYFGNQSGTADDVVKGELGIVDSGTGKIIPTTGSPETEVVQFLETLTDPTADALLHMQWTGY